MKSLPLLAVFVLLIAVARCGQSGAANDAASVALVLPDTLDLAYKDTLYLPGGKDWLTFDSLAHDSRCPTGATCVWEGSAEVGFAAYLDDARHAFTLNTHPRFKTDTTLTTLSMTVLDLTPYPHIDSTYQAEQYTVRVFVER